MQPDPRRDVPPVGNAPPEKPAPVHPLSLPPGWEDFCGVIRPGVRVRDFAARSQCIVGRCESRACDRKVRIEPRDLVEIGLGAAAMTKLARLWRCNRYEGCQMSLKGGMMNHDLQLAHITGHANVRVRMTCQGRCTFYRDVPVAEIIETMRPRVTHDPITLIVGRLGRQWTEPCGACGGARWTSEARVLEISGMDWKRKGEGAWALVAWRR